MMDLVSVVMPIYNNALFLQEAIESVLNLNYRNIEIIMVDDGSKDHSLDIAKKHAEMDSRIRLFKHEYNRGTVEALRTAIKHTKGNYIFFAAADDISLPPRIERCLEIFKSNSNIGIVIANGITIDKRSIETDDCWEVPQDINSKNISINQFKGNYCLGAMMAVVNDKKVLLKEGMLKYIDDYEIAIEYIMNGYDIGICREALVKYRLHEANISNNRRLMWEKIRNVLKKYEDDEIIENLIKRGHSPKNVYLTLGIVKNFLQQYTSSKKFLEKADILKDKDKVLTFENKFYLGVVNYKLDSLEESYKNFQQAINLDNNEPTVLNNYAVINILFNRNKELAKELLHKSLENKPIYIDARNNLDNMMQGKNSFKVTEKILDKSNLKRMEAKTN
ncbi:Glycosyl transferase family 2 [Natronincola peptidivorans]|uniref:Glycosyl transferase family 2 n=1 Tax=Natronincola peptidivorans TaxID=426128 RepID=A0A1H9ZSM9_9FIRM|nr:glycosyltransferase [Natronincola peptidivorans]SES84667.1 Glycosyl transferase family 2 [Natronincola peptidivorans]